jgi:hypothetical protein
MYRSKLRNAHAGFRDSTTSSSCTNYDPRPDADRIIEFIQQRRDAPRVPSTWNAGTWEAQKPKWYYKNDPSKGEKGMNKYISGTFRKTEYNQYSPSN